MDNKSYWDEYERVTGEARPPWIDGVGNVNYSYGKKTPKPIKLTAKQIAQNMPYVQAAPFNNNLMPALQDVQGWRPGLRGWQPGW